MDITSYTYFYKVNEPFGFLSQFYLTNFSDGVFQYGCAEQYMMAKKAQLFGDMPNLYRVLACDKPQDCKNIGREVRNFNPRVWENVKWEIVFTGNLYKFTQNLDLQKKLLATTGILVEASPDDKIWGIGLSQANAEQIEKYRWPGQNLLGKILTSIRDILLNN